MPATQVFTPEEWEWANQTAMRLRFLQADFSDRPAAERRIFLDEEVQRALRSVVAEKRGRHVQALLECFPTAFVRQAETVEAVPADNSPEALVAALVEIAPQLPKSLLAAFGLRLQEAGYMELKSTTLMDKPPEELLRTFPLDLAQPVDLQRIYRALSVFADFYIGLETIAWRVWKELAPGSAIRRDPLYGGDIKKTSARYLHGDREVAADQLRQIVERTRMLMGGLLGAIPAGGSAFMASFMQEFSPENIAALARAEKGLAGWTEDAKNWNKYKKLLEDQQGRAFEERMFAALAKKAEALMTGTHRKDP